MEPLLELADLAHQGHELAMVVAGHVGIPHFVRRPEQGLVDQVLDPGRRQPLLEGAPGLVSLQESGIAKVVKGITTFEEVLQKAPFSIRPRPVKEIFANIGEEL